MRVPPRSRATTSAATKPTVGHSRPGSSPRRKSCCRPRGRSSPQVCGDRPVGVHHDSSPEGRITWSPRLDRTPLILVMVSVPPAVFVSFAIRLTVAWLFLRDSEGIRRGNDPVLDRVAAIKRLLSQAVSPHRRCRS